MTPLDRLLVRPRRTDQLTFPMDPTAHDVVEATALADVLSDTDGSEVDAARAELLTVTFHVRGIGPEAVDALIAAHPATTEQRRAAREAHDPKPVIDIEGLRAALLAAVCERVVFSDGDEMDGLTPAEAADVLKRFSLDDRGEIQSRCLALDREPTLIVNT